MDSSANRTGHDEGLPEEADIMFDKRGCCCFVSPWSRRRTSASTSADWWERIQPSDRSCASGCLTEASMKLRDWSELIAGPRWKTFIRRFNKNSRNLGGSTRLGVRFQYDPLSYALNFDETPDADAGFRDFSSRYAAPPLSVKSSMDLGGRNAPPLFAAVPTVPAVAGEGAVLR
ncbi:uncharacterized protein LOC110031700 [Phalaenopsis equestris]|uniref:uncharacterized protein LOC110031700 n=1 Tax=Phalaenopsis equestris TaxID=78828 RepID=UPI0009E5F04C|nr:uncharacterized protein LOC110031700 [Phalaenopsis equestris]